MKKKTKIFLLLFVLLTVICVQLKEEKSFYTDSDIFWHLTLSKTMVEGKSMIDTTTGTYVAENIAYVPHEALFQMILYFLYKWLGWVGVYLLVGFSFFVFALGVYKLGEISREEMNLKKDNDYFHLFMLFYLFFIFLLVVDFKVIAVSMGVIVWYVVNLKKFMKKSTMRYAVILGLFSLLLSNLHGGTWIVSFIFFIFVLLDRIISKKMNRNHIFAFVFVFLGGIMNAGGMKSVLYAWEVGKYKSLLSSFQPIEFSSNFAFFGFVALFVLSAKYTFEKSWFEKFFILGLLYLGMASGYQHLYLLIFLPYFVACAIEKIPLKQEEERMISKNKIIGLIVWFVLILIALQFTKEDVVDKTFYPVEEMDYILNHHKGEDPPKVLADYVESGYIFYRGGEVLADPRMDPYVRDETKGIYGWTAIERQDNAFRYGFLEEEINYQKPDYVLLPKVNDENNSVSVIYLKKEKEKLGTPVFAGRYGEVYKID